MTRWIAVLLVIMGIAGAGRADAQESAPGPGVVEIALIPGGGLFFTENADTQEPSFGSYDLGAALTVNFNRYVGVEGEVAGAIGVSQSLHVGGVTADIKTPNLLNYSGNLVLSVPNRSAVVPYVTGGVGALSLFEKASLGIEASETFLTGNVGAGL